jgi:hypothetical protein
MTRRELGTCHYTEGRGRKVGSSSPKGCDPTVERRQGGGALGTQVRRARPQELRLDVGSCRDLRTRRGGW